MEQFNSPAKYWHSVMSEKFSVQSYKQNIAPIALNNNCPVLVVAVLIVLNLLVQQFKFIPEMYETKPDSVVKLTLNFSFEFLKAVKEAVKL